MTALKGTALSSGREQAGILVVSALTTSSFNAARRAALLARELGWPLRVLHVERVAGQVPAAQQALGRFCGQLQDRVGVAVAFEVTSGELLKEVLGHAHQSALLVIGSPRDNALKEQVGGATMDRLIRLSRIPTLVVKRRVDAAFAQGADLDGRCRYRQVLACVDLDPATRAVVAAAKALAPAARLEAFHALGKRALLPLAAPLASAAGVTALGQARSALAQLLGSEPIDGFAASVGFGSPGEAVLAKERAIGAELVVVGKRQRGLLADFFLGNVTRHVLSRGSADVLVLPSLHDRRPRSPPEQAVG